MSQFKSYPFIEKPPVLFGISLIDLLAVLIFFIALLLLGGFLLVIGVGWNGYYFISFFICLGLLFLLNKANTNRQPGYLISLYSYYFLQKKLFHVGNGCIDFQNLIKEDYDKNK